MPVQKQKIERWIKNGLYDAFALQGTGTRAAITLFETGFLPPAKTKGLEGKLFFAPVDIKGVLENIATKGENEWVAVTDALIEFSLNTAMRSVKCYASQNSEIFEVAKIIEKAGINPKHSVIMAQDLVIGAGESVGVAPDEEWLRVDAKLQQKIDDLLRVHRKKQSGVILSVNSRIAELGIKIDPDGDGIFISVPHGLSDKYIDGLAPLSEKDEQTIKDYLRGSC